MPPGVRNRPSYVMSFDFILCSNQPNGDFGRPAACHMSAKGQERHFCRRRITSGLAPAEVGPAYSITSSARSNMD
jgi:hypothetical protein